MRRSRIYGLLVAVLIGAGGVCTGQSVHRIGVGLHGGVYSLMGKDASGAGLNAFGGAGGIGFEYQWAIRSFVLATGLDAFAGSTAFSIEDYETSLPHSVDKDGYDFTYCYRFTGRKDRYNPIGLRVPLRVGLEWKGFQITAGASFYWHALCLSSVVSDVETWGEYVQFLDPFTDMPEHRYYQATPLREEGRSVLRPEVSVSLEAAYLIQGQYKVALFADYGATNALTSGSGSLVSVPSRFEDSPAMLEGVQLTDLLNSDRMAGGRLNSLYAGLRVSVLFPTAVKKTYPCRCLID